MYSKHIRSLAAAFLLVTSLLASPAQAATNLGGLDLWQWCLRYQQGEPGYPVILESPRTAYTWKCRSMRPVPATYPGGPTYSIVHTSIDTNAVCRWQYGSGAYAATYNWQDPYSWRCYR